MRNIFAVSDHHHGHANILKFTDSEGGLIRGSRFSCLEEMHETMIENHNRVVTSDSDIVYFLGDLTFDTKGFPAFFSRLRGRKRWIIGNHEPSSVPEFINVARLFQKIHIWRIFKDEKVVLSHFPLREDQFRHKVEINGHGHTHQHLVQGPYANLCMEHTDHTPVALEDIPALMAVQQASIGAMACVSTEKELLK